MAKTSSNLLGNLLGSFPGSARTGGQAGQASSGTDGWVPVLAPTPRSEVAREGTARLYRFHGSTPVRSDLAPVLLIPSLINRWFVLDLRSGASLVEALTQQGIDTFCLDWGIPEDEDRFLSWEDVLKRLGRAVRRVQRLTGAPRVGLFGYCMGGTLSGIYTALHPEKVAALVNLAGPYDFSKGGFLRHMVDPRWFDADAIADAGNVSPEQMQSGFSAMRPTLNAAKAVGLVERMRDPASREAFMALELWSMDNIPFPGAAYRTYIRELYQGNRLVQGTHRVGGNQVDLGRIQCPVLTIVAKRDAICPPEAARGLNEACGSADAEVLMVPGGHVGAVVGSRAVREMYPQTSTWLLDRLRPGRA